MFSGSSGRSVIAFWSATLDPLDGMLPAHARLQREDPPAFAHADQRARELRRPAALAREQRKMSVLEQFSTIVLAWCVLG